MKLVINISEQEYNECKNLFNMVYQEGYLNYNLNTALIMYIANGTVLPKGHGDLIDRKALLNRPYEKGGFVEWYDEIKHAPTIIEADKENK